MAKIAFNVLKELFKLKTVTLEESEVIEANAEVEYFGRFILDKSVMLYTAYGEDDNEFDFFIPADIDEDAKGVRIIVPIFSESRSDDGFYEIIGKRIEVV